MSEELLDSATGEPNGERPTFLTVLCILTFIGSGLGILTYLFAIIGLGAILGSLGGGAAAGGGILWSIFGLIAAVLSFYGALQMWKLKAQGFMIYVAGAVVGMATGIITSVSVGAGVGSMAMGLVFPILFIVLYNMNRKHLTA
ncbi:MAG: hypothetical protein N4A35_08060 [Flavobacteriales bacterium]|jgi:hypothetical protein|nr:hypothetical protein [Flavobacteriales bacterium]